MPTVPVSDSEKTVEGDRTLREKKFAFHWRLRACQNQVLTRSGVVPLVDPLVFPLVYGINSHRYLRTTTSCQGHLAKNLIRRTVPDPVLVHDCMAHVGIVHDDVRVLGMDAYLRFTTQWLRFCESVNQEVPGVSIRRATTGPENQYYLDWRRVDTLDGWEAVLTLLRAHLQDSRDPTFEEEFGDLPGLVTGDWCSSLWTLRG